MATNVLLDQGPTGTWVTVDAPALHVSGSDLLLDSATRRGGAGAGGYRRALVHDEGDRLTVNFSGDYSGGVRINDAWLNIARVPSGELPKKGAVGDLVLTVERSALGQAVTLWLCVGRGDTVVLGGGVYWVPLSQGAAVQGTA
jgi:hypothetical protein